MLLNCVVLEKTPESPLNSKEIQPVYSKGNLSRVFIGRTDAEAEAPILWPPDAIHILFKHKIPDFLDWLNIYIQDSCEWENIFLPEIVCEH